MSEPHICRNLACRYYGQKRCRCYPWMRKQWFSSELIMAALEKFMLIKLPKNRVNPSELIDSIEEKLK